MNVIITNKLTKIRNLHLSRDIVMNKGGHLYIQYFNSYIFSKNQFIYLVCTLYYMVQLDLHIQLKRMWYFKMVMYFSTLSKYTE